MGTFCRKEPGLHSHWHYFLIPHQLFIIEGMSKYIYEKLKQVPHTTTYKKEDTPRDLHFSWNRRILDFLIIVDEGWQLYQNRSQLGI